MRMKANDVADRNGLRNHASYMDAVRDVCTWWAKVLERREGLSMLKSDLVKMLADEMDEALYDAGFVDFDQGHEVPLALRWLLREIANAAV